jgi:hypothetical protein
LIPPLQVEGRVDIDVAGIPATLTGSGEALMLRTQGPAAVMDGLGLAGGRLHVLAAALAEAGLRLVVAGPRGPVATVGAGVSSPVGRLLAGSARVRLGAPAALLPVVRIRAGRSLRRHPWQLAAGAVGLAAGIGYGVYRSGHSGSRGADFRR